MTKDEMIELAKQAGWQYEDGENIFEALWAFGSLVAEKEGEAIAQMVEPWLLPEYVRKIRERGQK